MLGAPRHSGPSLALAAAGEARGVRQGHAARDVGLGALGDVRSPDPRLWCPPPHPHRPYELLALFDEYLPPPRDDETPTARESGTRARRLSRANSTGRRRGAKSPAKRSRSSRRSLRDADAGMGWSPLGAYQA